MSRMIGSRLSIVVLLSIPFHGQVDRIVIPAGTPEDHELQNISNEPDAQKKLAMYEDFGQKFSANPAAVAYGNWQVSQAYQATGDLKKALEYGDKALGGSPHNLDILYRKPVSHNKPRTMPSSWITPRRAGRSATPSENSRRRKA